jgi:hypothetical protein
MTGYSRRRHTICGGLIVALLFAGVTVTRAQTTTVPCQTYDDSCKSIITNVAIVGGIAIGALIAWKVISGHRESSQRNAAPRFLQVNYEPSSGTALEHMVMQAVSSNCPGTWSASDARLASGRLPPGLRLESDHKITGTPDASGTWQAGIGFSGLSCKGRDGKLQTYADRTVDVTIRIQ